MTIRHVVSWQLASADTAEKTEHARRISDELTGLVGVIPEIRTLEVGADVAGGGNWDVVLIADFDDLAAVARYQVHPEHQRAGVFIRSVVAARSCVDFEV